MTEVVVTREIKGLFSPETLAQYLGCTRRSVYNLIDSGQLRSYKVPGAGRRIKPEDVDLFLERSNGGEE